MTKKVSNSASRETIVCIRINPDLIRSILRRELSAPAYATVSFPIGGGAIVQWSIEKSSVELPA